MKSQQATRAGQETLQAILAVSFMLLPVLFGILELGDVVHAWVAQQSAAALGARVAGERGEDDSVVRVRIDTALRDAGLDPQSVTVAVSPQLAHWGEPIVVTLSSRRRLAIPFLLTQNVNLTSRFVARSEVNH